MCAFQASKGEGQCLVGRAEGKKFSTTWLFACDVVFIPAPMLACAWRQPCMCASAGQQGVVIVYTALLHTCVYVRGGAVLITAHPNDCGAGRLWFVCLARLVACWRMNAQAAAVHRQPAAPGSQHHQHEVRHCSIRV